MGRGPASELGGAQAGLIPTRDPALFLSTLFQSPPLLTIRGTPFQPGGDNPAQHRECLWKGTGRWIEGTGGQCRWGVGYTLYLDGSGPSGPSISPYLGGFEGQNWGGMSKAVEP